MKKLILSATLSILMFGNSAIVPTNVNAAGVPVVDAALATLTETNFFQEFANMMEQLGELQEQVKTAKSQLDTANDTFASMTDPREVMNALNSITSNFENLDASGILSDYNLTPPKFLEGESAEDAQAALERASEWLAKVDEFGEQALDRNKELKKLVAKTNTTKDLKESADLNNRILAEVALVGNENLKAQMASQEASAKKDLEFQKALQKERDRIFAPAKNYF